MSIELKNVDYVYDSGEPFEYFALRGISLHIDDGAFVGIVAVSYTHLTLPTIYSV